LIANEIAVLIPRREVKCMNEISSGVALWILDKWRLSKSQLQASIFRDGKSQGTPATIEEISPGKEKILVSIEVSGQPAKWNLPVAGCRFSFGVPLEVAVFPEFAEGKWVSYLNIELPTGETVVFAERFFDMDETPR
jgi:hypothetical protein